MPSSPDSGVLAINSRLRVPRAEFEFRASRAGGPGGQHVNTSSTRVEVRWQIAISAALTDEQRERLLRKLGRRVDSTGTLRVVSDSRRSQLQNREAALERLQELVAAALVVPKTRRATRPTRASKERRLADKRHRARRKSERRDGGD